MPFEDPNAVQAAPTQVEWDAVQTEREADPQAPAVTAAEVVPAEVVPAAVEVVVDPYSGYSPADVEKLKRFDTMLAEQPKLVQALKETQGRVSAMQSEFAKRPAVAAGPNENAIAAAAKDPEKWAALKKDFPEWGEGISAFVDARFEALGKSGMTPEQMEQMVSQRVGTALAPLAAQFQVDLIESKYPSWNEDVKTPEFKAWFDVQKPEVQALSNSDRGRDALRMLDLFSEAKAKPVAQTRSTRQAVLAAAVQGKPGAPVATKTVETMSGAELWNFEAAERAKRT